MFDTHIHTNNSHDSKQTIDEICSFAIENGINAVSFTDHVDIGLYDNETNFNTAKKVFEDVKKAQSIYGKKLQIFAGIELGAYIFDPKTAEQLCNIGDFDIILGSVHSFVFNGNRIRFSRDWMGEDVSIESLKAIVDAYFTQVLSTVEIASIDVLCHMTYPLRYINGKFKRDLSLNPFEQKLNKILKTLIEREIALEVNTSGLNSWYGETLPSVELIEKYYSMGGRMITLGSDAHYPDRIANGFREIKPVLRNIGFEKYYYFQNRQPKPVLL